MSSNGIGAASLMMHNANTQPTGASRLGDPEAQAFVEIMSVLEKDNSSQTCGGGKSLSTERQSPLNGMTRQELEDLLLSALNPATDTKSPNPIKITASNIDEQPINSSTSNHFGNPGIEALRSQPEQLDQGPERGAKEFSNINLQTGADGYLTGESRQKVDQLLQDLTEGLGGREVHASVFDRNGELSIRLTAGSTNAVTHRVMPGTLYNAHTHPGGTIDPSQIDLYNANRYAQDAVVVNGQSYIYA